MPHKGFGGMLLFLISKTELNGVVAIGVFRFDLENGAWARLDQCNRYGVALVVEDLGHSQFLGQDSFSHDVFLLLPSYPSRPH